MVAAGATHCPSEFARLAKFAAFSDQVRSQLPDHKTPEQLQSWILDHVVGPRTLSPEGVQALREGQNPFLTAWLRQAMAEMYLRRIDESDLAPAKKVELREALRLAVEELAAAERSSWSVRDEAGRAVDTEEQARSREALERFLKSDALRRCVLRAGILVGVSETITVGALLSSNLNKYAPGEESTWEKLRSPETYANGARDSYTQLMLVSNGILMSAIGGLRCFPRSMLLSRVGIDPDGRLARYVLNKYNVIAALSATTSIVSQYLVAAISDDDEKKKHWLSWNQVLLDTGWSYFATWRFDGLVIPAISKLEATRLPYQSIYVSFITALDQYLGGVGYTQLQNVLRNRGLLPKE